MSIIWSCKTSKKVKVLDKEQIEVKVEFQNKLDSLTEIWIKYVQKNLSKKDTAILKTDFEINFSKKDSGTISLQTPNGVFKAEKKGNGNLRILGQVKNSQIKENQENSTTQKEVNRTILNEQNNTQVKTDTSQKKATHEVEKHGNWFARLWWLWLIIAFLLWLAWKLKPFRTRFI